MSQCEPTLKRPDLVAVGADRLSPMEKWQIRFIRRTFDSPRADRVIRTCQRWLGSMWIHAAIKNLWEVHGYERFPKLSPEDSFVIVSNHRSFFDQYVIMAHLVRTGVRHRMLFPVRSHFWYDSKLGFVINGLASFFAMYPPIFRDRKKMIVNGASLEEMAWLLHRGGTGIGIHPEGTRNQGENPYELLPAQSGVGKLIHSASSGAGAASRVMVIPCFQYGLTNELAKQVVGSFSGSAQRVIMVFGEPIDFADLLAEPASPKLYMRIAERCMEHIAKLGEEERAYRAAPPPKKRR